MSAGKYNIFIEQGSDFSLQLTVQESGSAKNLSGYSVRGQLRSSIDAASASASFTGQVTNPSAGILTVSLPFSTTESLNAGVYNYDIEIFTSGSVQKLLKGLATVTGEITRWVYQLLP